MCIRDSSSHGYNPNSMLWKVFITTHAIPVTIGWKPRAHSAQMTSKWVLCEVCLIFFLQFCHFNDKSQASITFFYDKSPKKVTNSLINLNTHYSRYPPSLKALEMAVQFVCSILDEIKWRTHYLKDDNVKLCLEVIIAVTFLDAVATVDHLKAIIT